MGIPESQLETWSHQGAIASAKATHESIRNALSANTSPIRDEDYEVYLQGSYKNDTNIRGDSDVDIVVQLNSTFQHDLSALSEYERTLFEQSYSGATYSWENFRSAVLKALRVYYGTSAISEGNKSINVTRGSGRLSADVVVCIRYRKYQSFRSIYDQRYIEGMAFYALRENRWINNFPKIHYDNGVNKNGQYTTNGWYKPTVRVFKNARTYLVSNAIVGETLAPSYFLECLLYNVRNEYFGSNYQDTFLNVLKSLVNSFINGHHGSFTCQNEQLALFGPTPEQWLTNNAIELLKSMMDLWENW